MKLHGIETSESTVYNNVKMGENVGKFVKQIHKVKTHIGESRGDLVVYGARLTSSHEEEITDILTKQPFEIGEYKKLEGNLGITAEEALRAYAMSVNAEDKIGEVLAELAEFNSYRTVVEPLRIGKKCKVKNHVEYECCETPIIRSVDWKLNNEKNRIECGIRFNADKALTKVKKNKSKEVSIENYGKTLYLCEINDIVEMKNAENNIIEMTCEGIIQPIELEGEEKRLVIDGRNIYSVTEEDIKVVAVWKNREVMEINDGLKEFEGSKVLQVLTEEEGYIAKHLNYIAPYGFYKTNVVRLESCNELFEQHKEEDEEKIYSFKRSMESEEFEELRAVVY